jgi:hypothetical protein
MLTEQPHRQFCMQCKLSLVKPNGKSKHGFQKWHKYCSSCAKANYNKKYGYRLHKKTSCDSCGFTAKDKCQLDLIYKDGNRNNKSEKNILTLCANCNRLYQKQLKIKKKSILDITVDCDVIL